MKSPNNEGDRASVKRNKKKRWIPLKYGCGKKYFTSTWVSEKTTQGTGGDHRINLPQMVILYAKNQWSTVLQENWWHIHSMGPQLYARQIKDVWRLKVSNSRGYRDLLYMTQDLNLSVRKEIYKIWRVSYPLKIRYFQIKVLPSLKNH